MPQPMLTQCSHNATNEPPMVTQWSAQWVANCHPMDSQWTANGPSMIDRQLYRQPICQWILDNHWSGGQWSANGQFKIVSGQPMVFVYCRW